jgi:hypothetical protein
VNNAASACETPEWATKKAKRDVAKTDEAAFRAALVSVATECCGLGDGAVTAAASTNGRRKPTREGLVQLATEVLRAKLAGGLLAGVFAPAARREPRSYAHLDDAKARARASDADGMKGLGEAYDALAATLASFLPADVLPKPTKKAEGFSRETGPKLFAPATRVLNEIAAEATAAAGPAPAPAPDATQPMDVDGAGAEAPRVESGDAPAPTPAPSQGERPIASRDATARLKARQRMIASAGAHDGDAVKSLVELLGPLGLDAERAEELVRDIDRADAKAHEEQKQKDAVAAPRTARRPAPRWTSDEEASLRTIVAERQGPGKWEMVAERLGTGRTAIAVEEKWKKLKAAATTAPPPLLVGGRPHKRPKVPKQVVVGARVVWMKYGYEGVVEAEVTPGVFRVLFDKGGFRDSLRAEELRVL